jgi:hypothetical protein
MQLRFPMTAITALLFSACVDGGGDDDQPIDPPTPECVSDAQRATKTVEVRGTVVDFITGEPVEGASVDITTAWDVTGNFPAGTCPMLASVKTGADGKFGPVVVKAGSPNDPPIMAFLVRGAGRAQIADDNRAACDGDTCILDHTIPAPSIDTARAWRKELAAGGMSDALTRGLVLFKFKETDGSGASDVIPRVMSPDGSEPVLRGLVAGQQVRFLETDKATLANPASIKTTASGLALIGMDGVDGQLRVAGERGTATWLNIGCLVQSDWIFFEDRTGG